MTKVFNVQTEGGQGEIQDYDLHQQTAVQTVAATDYVMLQDTNGAYHKILRNSLVDALRDVIGASIGGAALGTDIQKIPALGTNDVLGFGTLANIASVLGVTRCARMMGNVDDTNVDQKTDVGFYQHPGAIRTGGNWGVLFVYKGGYEYIVQLDYEFSALVYYVRYSTNGGATWGSWHQIPTDIPTFYKDYATLNDLFSALEDINRLYGETFLETDLNAAADGLREFGTDTQNSPIPNNYGMVFTSSLDWSTNRRFCRLQICVNQLCSVFYFRICWNGTWSAWNNLMQ